MIAAQKVGILPSFGSIRSQAYDNSYGFSEPIDVERDICLSSANAPTSMVYWIEAGVVKKIALQKDGSESIVGLRTNGWIVGAAAALVPGRPEPIAVTATKCVLRSMPASAFVAAYHANPRLSHHITNLLALELALRMRADSRGGTGTLRARLEQFLRECDFVSETLHAMVSPLRLKRAEIAQIVGSTPEHLSCLLDQMEEEGALDQTRSPFM